MGSSNDVSYLAEVICAMRRVLVFDLIGTNNSVSTHNHLDDAVFYASSLAELLLVLGEDKPIDLIGFSMGGGVTSKFAALYPKSINSLVQIAPVGFKRQRKLLNDAKVPLLSFLVNFIPFMEHIFANIFWKKPSPSEAQFDDHNSVNFRKYHLYACERFANPLQRQFGYTLIKRLLEMEWGELEGDYKKLMRLSIPVLIMWGGEDKIVPYCKDGLENVFGLWEGKGSVENIIVKDAQHMYCVEHPVDCSKYIENFWERVSRCSV